MKIKYKHFTSFDGTFKHARNAGLSNFWSKTPRQGNPEFRKIKRIAINKMEIISALYKINKNI